jgi:peptidoglycan/LPS O-acetylase OafA/YrhL
MYGSVKSEQRIGYLDGWRAVAIISVLVGHFIGVPYVNFGRFGVELFFVLSGRLMADILFVKNTSLRLFFPKRFSRVYPAMFMMATAMFVLSIARGRGVSLLKYLSVVTFTYNYAQLSIGRTAVLDHIWSLCVEEHMYILLGIVAYIYRKWQFNLPVVIIGIALLGISIGAMQTYSGMPYNEVYWRSDVRGASILIGSSAFLLKDKIRYIIYKNKYYPIIIFTAAIILNLEIFPDYIKYSIGTILLAISLISMGEYRESIPNILNGRILLAVGTYSYSIYIWQQPFYQNGHDITQRIMLFPLVIICSIVSFVFVEKPARAFLNGIITRYNH